jgi:phosphoribosylformylglycinamidine synthase
MEECHNEPCAFYFGEEQARYIITTTSPTQILDMSLKAGVTAKIIGKTTADGRIILPENCSIAVEDLYKMHDSWFPDFMRGA